MSPTISSNALLMSQMMSQPLMISSLLTHAKKITAQLKSSLVVQREISIAIPMRTVSNAHVE